VRRKLDDRPLAKRIGLIILATDHTTEVDFQRMVASERIGVYVTRIPYANPVTPENLMKMQPSLTAGATLILPDEPLDAVMYSCTSGSVVIGEDLIESGDPGGKTGRGGRHADGRGGQGPESAGCEADFGADALHVETSRPMAEYFAHLGFEIDRFTCLGLSDDREMARIAPDEITAFAEEAMAPESDALFISCTALRAAEVVPRIEHVIGKPVVTSNLATAWACLGICGDHGREAGARHADDQAPIRKADGHEQATCRLSR
jgi:maleate isomerase